MNLTPDEKSILDRALWELAQRQKFSNSPNAKHIIEIARSIAEKFELEVFLQLYYELGYDKITEGF